MERVVTLSWLLLAALHALPAMVLFVPAMVERLYGTPPSGDIGILLVHRGALFLAVLAAAVMAALHSPSRQLASLIVAISMLTFLWLFLRGGSPASLRTIFLADLVGLAPLALVCWDAWSRPLRS
jgi:hypothetical protein